MAPRRIASALLLFLTLALCGCGRRPAQDYVVTGTLRAASRYQSFVSRVAEAGGRMELVMTVRSSPDVSDVIVQRRWIGTQLPHEFGLGKGLGEYWRAKHPKVWITALLDIYPARGEQPFRSLVGWTSDPVPAGTYHVDMELTHELGEVDPEMVKGYPRGGWSSRSVLEEAVPPGYGTQDPGPLVFAGTIDVSPAVARQALRGYRLYVSARYKDAGGAPDLITFYDHPVFPFRYSLHENHRFFGEPGPIEEPLFVYAFLDLDGRVDTKDDQVRAQTPERVDPLREDIDLTIDVADFLAKKAAAGGDEVATTGAGANPHGVEPDGSTTAGPAARVASGSIMLPDALAASVPSGAVLWVSARDAETNNLLLSRRVSFQDFPVAFEIDETHTLMGGGRLRVTRPVKVSVKLTDKDPRDEGALTAMSQTIDPGTTGVELILARPN